MWACAAVVWNHLPSFLHLKEKSLWFTPVFHKDHFDRVVAASCKAAGVWLRLHYSFIQSKISVEGCRRVAQLLFSCSDKYVGLCNLFTWSLLRHAYGESGIALVILASWLLSLCRVVRRWCKEQLDLWAGTQGIPHMCCLHVLPSSTTDKP